MQDRPETNHQPAAKKRGADRQPLRKAATSGRGTSEQADAEETDAETCWNCVFSRFSSGWNKKDMRCVCWHVKGKDGGYKKTKAWNAACRWYISRYASCTVSDTFK